MEVGSHFVTHTKLLFDSFKTTRYVIIDKRLMGFAARLVFMLCF